MRHAFVAERFTTEAVFIETFKQEAFIDTSKTLVTFVKQAFNAERFTMDAAFIETFEKEALVDT